jgi:hypothetical protein
MNNVYVTFYGFDDNDDGAGHFGTAAIAYPGLHKLATEDAGTYDAPSTFAASKAYFTPGERIYVPRIQKYYIMEDDCVEADADAKHGKIHVDLYMGGNTALQGQPLINCEDALTSDGFVDTIITNPPSILPVFPGKLFDGMCHIPPVGSTPPTPPTPPTPNPTPTLIPSNVCDLTGCALQTVVNNEFKMVNPAGFTNKQFTAITDPAGDYIKCLVSGTEPHSSGSSYPRCELKCLAPLSGLFSGDFNVNLPLSKSAVCFAQIKTSSQEIQVLRGKDGLYVRDINANHYALRAQTGWFNLKVLVTAGAVQIFINGVSEINLSRGGLLGVATTNWKCGNYMQSANKADVCWVGMKNLLFK